MANFSKTGELKENKRHNSRIRIMVQREEPIRSQYLVTWLNTASWLALNVEWLFLCYWQCTNYVGNLYKMIDCSIDCRTELVAVRTRVRRGSTRRTCYRRPAHLFVRRHVECTGQWTSRPRWTWKDLGPRTRQDCLTRSLAASRRRPVNPDRNPTARCYIWQRHHLSTPDLYQGLRQQVQV